MSSLRHLLEKISRRGGKILLEQRRLSIDVGRADLLKIRPYLYLLLNQHEDGYFIAIRGMPYCLMPDAASHFSSVYPSISAAYRKTRSCDACAYKTECPGWPLAYRSTRPCAVPDRPREIVIDITHRCNLHCALCQKNGDAKDLSVKQIKTILADCRKNGVGTLRITGGEPLLHPFLSDILALIKSEDMHCMLNSNATLLKQEHLVLFRSYVDNILISLQGYHRASDARLSGSGSLFEKKVKNILALRRVIPVLRIGTIVTKTLIGNFAAYAKLIRLIKPDCWEFYRPMTVGPVGPEYALRAEDYAALVRCLRDADVGHCGVKIANAFPFCALDDPSHDCRFLLGGLADDGHRRLIYDTRGFFKPSYFIDTNLGHDLNRAWNHPFLKKIRSLVYLPPRCRACDFLTWCRGGSRFLAKEFTGDYFGKDPLVAR